MEQRFQVPSQQIPAHPIMVQRLAVQASLLLWRPRGRLRKINHIGSTRKFQSSCALSIKAGLSLKSSSIYCRDLYFKWEIEGAETTGWVCEVSSESLRIGRNHSLRRYCRLNMIPSSYVTSLGDCTFTVYLYIILYVYLINYFIVAWVCKPNNQLAIFKLMMSKRIPGAIDCS